MDLKVFKKKVTNNDKIQANKILESCYNTYDNGTKLSKLKEAFVLNPNNINVVIQLGLSLIQDNNEYNNFIGYNFLECAFDTNLVDTVVPINSKQGRYLAFIVGRYNHQLQKYKTSERFFKLGNLSSFNKDDFHEIQLATHISGYPESTDHAKKIIKIFNKRIDTLLAKDNIVIKYIIEEHADIYNHCVLTPFNLEIYYECDIKLCMKKHVDLARKIFPELTYISPHIQSTSVGDINTSRLKIGIASAFFNSSNNSVISDFGGVIERLPTNIFDITFVNIVEASTFKKDDFVFKDKPHVIIDSNTDPNWLQTAHTTIGNLKLDLLLYLDSTMSPVLHRIMMSKLAKVQAVSHGHPVTSGIDRNIVDFYVSWEAAELDYNIAKHHYTEELIFLPKDNMHQYYEHRSLPGGFSAINNMCYNHLERTDFSEFIPSDGTWYLCMQKPFKRHPEFEPMLASILQKDPNGRIILHDTDHEENKLIIDNRLRRSNCDMNRIHLIPSQQHHKLLALYKLSDVILDSYHAGGCTTTREALELGAPVVTLPSKYLGGRWSLAYYSIMNMLDLVAEDKEDYVQKAVEIGTNYDTRQKVKQKILDNVHKLFFKQEAVTSWSNILCQMISKQTTPKISHAVVEKPFTPEVPKINNNNIHEYLTIGIKTFNRPLCLKNCMEHIRRLYKDLTILVADDSDDILKIENKLYIKENNASLVDLPYNVGLSAGRNCLVTITTTKYYLTLDDDNYIDENTNILDILNFMEDNSNVKLIGGICNDRKIYSDMATRYTYTFSSINNFDIFCKKNHIKIDEKLNLYKTNLVLNLFIAHTDMLRKFPWDSNLKFEEHTPFFVNLYKENITCAFTELLIFREITDSRRTYIKTTSPYTRVGHNIKYNLKIATDPVYSTCIQDQHEILPDTIIIA